MPNRFQQNMPPRPDRATDLAVGCVRSSCAHGLETADLNILSGRSTGRVSGRSTRRPQTVPLQRGLGRALAALLIVLLPLTVDAATIISNMAVLTYSSGGLPQPPLPSNRVDLAIRTPSTIEFLRYDPAAATTLPVPATDYRDGGGAFVAIPPPAATATQPVPLTDAPTYPGAEDLYLRLIDLDQNLDPALAETVLVTVTCVATGDSETLRLTETGPDTGIFSGYLPTGPVGTPAADGTLTVTGNARITTGYVDSADATDTAADLTDIVGLAGQLWVEKRAAKTVAAVGDFVPYRLAVTNTDPAAPALATRLVDRLPPGFRYQSGSTRVDGGKAADPSISGDGRTLTFDLGDLPAGTSREVRYVAAIGTLTRPGTAINEAHAVDTSGHRSNNAKSAVRIVEELLRSRAYVLGRVIVGSCDAAPETLKGLGGVRIYLEDGTYTTTDSDGLYHFEGVTPGSHVVQLDLDTLPPVYQILPCEENTRFAGRSFSQFVDLQGGTLWRADFHVGLRPHINGEATLELHGAIVGRDAQFNLPFTVGGVDLKNLRLTVMLPDGLTYLPASSTLNGTPVADPQVSGPSLTYRLGDKAAGWQGTLTLRTALGADRTTDLPVKALLTFNTPQQNNQRTPVAETQLAAIRTDAVETVPTLTVRPRFPTFVADLTAADKAMLDEVIAKLQPFRARSLQAIGHTDNVGISARSRHIFADNFALSRARAASVASYVGAALGIAPANISAEGKADTEPVAGNGTEEGRALNRRVELILSGEKLIYAIDYKVTRDGNGQQRAKTLGQRPGENESAAAARPPLPPVPLQPPRLDAAWLAQAGSTSRIVWPADGYVPETPNIEIFVQTQRDEQLELRHNGVPVAGNNFDNLINVPGSSTVIKTWAGVDLQEGRNSFEATLSTADGRQSSLSREIWYVSTADKLEIVEDRSRLLADGSRPPYVAVRITDPAGHPVHPGRRIEYSVAPPYAVWSDPLLPKTSTGEAWIGADGVALLQLEPTTQTGEVHISIPLDTHREETSVWLQPLLRDWILVGLAEGTAGYNAISGNMQSFASTAGEENLYADERIAFFAKGRIKGSWLLTMAYDSGKAREDSLHRTIDPDSYYTLYGDASEQRYEAASARKLYLKIERQAFYALFGDYDTGLTVTELARYSRSLNGLKSEYRGNQLSYNAFASETTQAKVRDQIRGDGTSGLYRLTRHPIVLNSEKIVIESRDRFHSETVTASQVLSRHIDYDIDYDAGTLFFKEPVPSRDADLNPVTIVVDYETTGGDKAYTYGGRVAVHPLGERVEVGVSHIHEGGAGNEGDLSAVDAKVMLDRATALRVETASSDSVSGDGSAYLAELTHRGRRLEGRAYVREQDEGFGLGQQSSTEQDTRKLGADLRYRLTDRWRVGGEVARLEKLTTGAEQDLARADVQYARQRYQLGIGLLEATDRHPAETLRSEQLTLGGRWQPTDVVSLRIDHAQSLGGRDGSADYPTRTNLGLDYRLGSNASAFAEQEFTRGAREDTNTTRLGLKGGPWEGAQAQSSLGQESSEYGPRVFANTGLKQTWRINPTWSVDAGFDRSDTLRHPGNDPVNGDAPPASGNSEDFTAVSAGANRKAERWTMSNRLEYRHGESEDKYGVYSGTEGDIRRGLALSGRLQLFETRRATGSSAIDGSLRLGLAYRPLQTRWIVLDRLDYLFDRETGSDRYNNWRLVNNLNANYRSTDRKLQVSLQYGAKYVQENIDGGNYSGYTDLIGIETRYDVTRDWDLSFRSSVLHSWSLQQFDYSAGPAVGYKVLDNAWLSVGYNFTGFTDRDFSAADYTAQGAYLKFRVKFDQESVRAALARF